MTFTIEVVNPVNQPTPGGHLIMARFVLGLAPGITRRLALAWSARDGVDLVWSARSGGAPVVELSRERRAKIAAAVRAELAACAAVEGAA